MNQHCRTYPRRLPPFARLISKTTVIALVFLVTSMTFVSRYVLAAGEDEAETALPSLSGFRATVAGDVCNLRSGPSTNYSVKRTVTQGTLVDVLSTDGQWVMIRCQETEGWIAGWLLDIDLAAKAVRARVVKSDVNVREGPGLDTRVIRVTQRDTVYSALYKRGEWVKVALEENRSGWIHESLLQLEFARQEIQEGTLLVYPAGESLQITQSPVAGSTALASLKKGESAVVTGSEGAYFSVETLQGIRGWVHGPSATLSSTTDQSLTMAVGNRAWSIGKHATATVVRTDVNFRSGPGTNYSIVGMLQKGDTLRVLDTVNGWIKGVSPKGVTGYVAGWLTSGVKPAEPLGFSVTLDASGKSRILTVTGPFQSAAILPGPTENSFSVSTSEFFGTNVEMPVNAYEFTSLKVATSDVTVNLAEKANYVVKTNAPGKVVLEFAPKVTSVNVATDDEKEILTIDTLGYVWPTVKREGSNLIFFLPGASLTDAPLEVSNIVSGRSIKSVTVTPADGGLNITLSTQGEAPFVLRKAENCIQAHFATPGLEGKVIVIDPGHDSDDPGAIGVTGVVERDVNWEIATRLKNLLESAGATVQMTRSSLRSPSEPPPDWSPDPSQYAGSLAKRAAWSEHADIFVSIHNDWHSNRSVSGTTSYTCGRTLNILESQRLASCIQEELTAVLGTVDKGIRDADFFVTREAVSPSVLVEVMYLSNADEEASLRQPSTWDKAAEGLFRAIRKYFAPPVVSPGA